MGDLYQLVLTRDGLETSADDIGHLLQSSIKIDLIRVLSNEVILQVFSWLNIKDLTNLSRVCKSWKVFTQDETLWRLVSERELGSKRLYQLEDFIRKKTK